MKRLSKRFITTRAEYDLRDGKYVLASREGYWYEGPVALAASAPNWVISNWGFFEDGTESGATQIGSTNTNPTKGDIDVDTIFLFRADIEEDSGNTSKNTTGQLQYSLNGGTATDVTATSLVVRMAGTGSGLTDTGDTASARLGGTYTYDSTNEGQCEVDGLAGGGTADLASTGCEFVWAVTVRSADVSEDDAIVLSFVPNAVTDDTTPTFPTWPTITVPAIGSATLTSAVDADIPSIEGAAVSYRNFWRASVDADVQEVTAFPIGRYPADIYLPMVAGDKDIGTRPKLKMYNLRATIATIIDYTGVCLDVLAYENRYPSGRRVRNLAYTDIRLWTTYSEGYITSGISDPDGGNNAHTITKDATGWLYWQDYSPNTVVSDGDYVRNSLWIRRRTGTGTVKLYTGGGGGTLDITSDLSATWKRITGPVKLAATASTCNIGVQIATTATGDEIDVYLPLCELINGKENQNPSEPVQRGGNFNAISYGTDFSDGSQWTYVDLYWDVNGDTATTTTDTQYPGTLNVHSEIESLFKTGDYVVCQYELLDTFTNNIRFVAGNSYGTYHTAVGVYIDVLRCNSDSPSMYFGPSVEDSGHRVKIHFIQKIETKSGLDGIEYFDTENGNTVSGNVVTEAQGSGIQNEYPKGFVTEKYVPNRNTYSNDLTNAAYTNVELTSVNTGDFLAGMQAFGLVANTVNGSHAISKASIELRASEENSFSFFGKSGDKDWVKAGIGNSLGDGVAVFFNLSTGETGGTQEDGSGTINRYYTEEIFGGYRCTIVFNNTTGTTGDIYVRAAVSGTSSAFAGDASTVNVTLTGLQVEWEPWSASLVKTTSVVASRSADQGRAYVDQ